MPSPTDPESLIATFQARLADWRMTGVVYQVFVDRFAIGQPLDERRHLFEAPARLRRWNEPAVRRPERVQGHDVRRHEMDFWGGDLRGVTAKIDHIRGLGADVIYLNPVFRAFTNHKYDTIDWFDIDARYGSGADLKDLADAAHAQGMRVVLDGVFNHSGRLHPWFRAAQKDPESPYRSWYTFGPGFSNGYLSWRDVPSLPELNLENPDVRDALWRNPDSVVRHWLHIVDGWRIDVANDIGPEALADLRDAARKTRGDTLVVGELFNYPLGWFHGLDGALLFFLRTVLLALAEGRIQARVAMRIVENLVNDVGIEPLLRSWHVLSNHDLPRLATLFPDLTDRVFLWSLMIGLPGLPLVYQGEEMGMTGGPEPECRGPMEWNRLTPREGTAGRPPTRDAPPEFATLKELLQLRRRFPSLSVGDFVPIETHELFAFARRMVGPTETVIVVANPTRKTICEPLCPRDPWLMDASTLREIRTGAELRMASGFLWPEVPPRTVQFWNAGPENTKGYRFFKRVPRMSVPTGS